MASGIDYNLLQNQPKNWKFEYDGSTKEIKVSYMSKYFAANESDIKWIFVQKNLPQNERDKVLVYFAHFVKSISIRNKASGGLKATKQSATERKETKNRKVDSSTSSSSSSSSSSKDNVGDKTYKGRSIKDYSDKELAAILKDLGLPHVKSKVEKILALCQHVGNRKIPKQLKQNAITSSSSCSSSCSSSSSSSSLHKPFEKSDGDGCNDISNEMTMTFALQSNKGNRGRRRYIDVNDDDKKKRKMANTRTISKKTKYANMNHELETGVIQYFAGAKRGNKGINQAVKSHSKRPSVFPTMAEISKLKEYISLADPLYKHRQDYNKRIADDSYKEWLWITQLNFNVIVYGIGDKVSLVRDFAKKQLYDEDVIAVDGWSASSSSSSSSGGREAVVKELLDTIWSGIINSNTNNTTANNNNNNNNNTQANVMTNQPSGHDSLSSSGSSMGHVESSWSLLRYVYATVEALHAHYSLSGKELFGRDAKGERV